jgi:hypothetical protein
MISFMGSFVKYLLSSLDRAFVGSGDSETPGAHRITRRNLCASHTVWFICRWCHWISLPIPPPRCEWECCSPGQAWPLEAASTGLLLAGLMGRAELEIFGILEPWRHETPRVQLK